MQLSVPDPEVRDGGREEITNIKINVTMPDGSNQEVDIDQGQTVEFLRAYLHEHSGVPFVGSTLTFDGRAMFDPMSLVDFQVKSGCTLVCTAPAAAEGGDI
mmetsp:Transcript_64587/g.154105  ORF Transcript_64587/g.154105 Transcript_64587/m.154105 type:complete len:101 (+) Transcript_64587:118-420(+)|eukprot:CAMPEP_0180119732 /NCGR_PEP_ID=MMETSP0986-20121125/2143_1 /TAXON_ID=697907 /ORGANISM="non described non described, Strain CCMP2293" /LENGTH=100 /DNA_ID=CAMNT_0022058761 /DNA_START=106 /DNA_END=408 /DNA_ORIENTATION=-